MDALTASQSSSRPSKVTRTDQGDNVAIAIPSVKNKLDLYFDTLDDNALDHVAKYLRAKAWTSFTRLADIISLIPVRGKLGSFLRHRCFNTLRITSVPHFQEPLKKGEIWATGIKSALQFVVLAGGFLRTIHLDMQLDDEMIVPEFEWDSTEWAFAFSMNCPNVRSLEVTQGGSGWIRKFGGRLESLRLSCPPTAFIEDNCPRLRHFKVTLWDSDENKSIGGNA